MKTSRQIFDDVIKKRNARKAKLRATVLGLSTLCVMFALCVGLVPLINHFAPSGDGTTTALEKPIDPQQATYGELYNKLSSLLSTNPSYIYNGGGSVLLPDGATAAAAEEIPSEDAVSGADKSENEDYSGTNLQVVGVDEADVIKSDGKYIYALSGNCVHIISADKGQLEQKAKLTVENGSPFEMFLYEDRLIVLVYEETYTDKGYSAEGSVGTGIAGGIAGDEGIAAESPAVIAPDVMPGVSYPYYYGNQSIRADIYDVSDRSAPKLVNTYSQDGSYQSSRLIGDKLYIVTNKTVYGQYLTEDNLSTYVPSYSVGGEKNYIPAEDIYLRMNNNQPYQEGYLFVCGVDISGEVKYVSGQAILGCGNTMYANTDSIYVVAYGGGVTENEIFYTCMTKIFRLAISDGQVVFTAENYVKGSVLNQFSMDEYKGTFRIVTTVYSYKVGASGDGTTWSAESGTSNTLYTLDKNLNVIGSIEDIAPGERVYSVRFDGDIGFVVTYRQTDPLFTIDLSDPANPAILHALKIPGFSEYLHVYTPGRLFGLGRDDSGFLKLSMFDTSDKTDVTEKSTLVIEGVYYSPAEYNHKAILINGTKNIIAFMADDYNGQLRYYVYSYSDEGGFEQKAVVPLSENSWYYTAAEARGMFIGDYLYVISAEGIQSFDMSTYENADLLSFK